MALNVGELYAQLTMETDQFDSAVGGLSDKLKGVGGMITGALGGAAIAAVGALGGAIVGGVVSVNNYQKALNGLQTQTGATDEEIKSMGDSMKNVYARNFGEDFNDVADTMAFAKQSTGAFGEELEYLTQDALMLRDTFQMDVTESLRGADAMMGTFGSTGTEAMAMIAQATQKGLNKNGDLVDSIEEYSIYFENAGLDAQDMFAIFENASKSGVRNLDLVGDTMKEFSILMQEEGGTASEALTTMGLDANALQTQFASGGEGAKKAFQTVISELDKVKDPLEQNTLGVQLFGTMFEEMEADAVLAMGNLNGTITGTVDTLDKINAIKYSSFTEAMAGIGRQIQVGLIMPIGEKLLPILNDFANWLAGKMPTIIAYFQGMGDKVTAMAAIFAPAIETAKAVFQGLVDKVVETVASFGLSFDGIGAKASGFATTLSNVFTAIWAIVGPIMDLVMQKVMEVVTIIVSWWQSNGQALLENVMIVFKGIYSVIQFIMPAVLAIISMVFENIKGVVSGALKIISGIFAIFAGLFTGNWSKMWDGVKTLISGALQFIWNLWQLMLYGKLIAGIKMLATKGLGLFKNMWSSIQSGFGRFTNWITSLVVKLVSSVVSKFTSLGSRAVSIFNTLRAFGASIWSALSQAVINIVTRIVSGVMSKITSLRSRATDAFNGIKSAASRIFNAVKTAITKPIETAKNTVLRIIDAIKGAFSRMKIKIPKPKLPKISISTKKNALFGIDLPSFNVDWFKTGGIATGPAIAGVGEAGSEAIVPLSGRRMKPFSDAIGQQVAKALGGVNTAGGQPIVVAIEVDGREFARATAKYYDEETERKENQTGRARGFNVT